jgi:hypothetical protein
MYVETKALLRLLGILCRIANGELFIDLKPTSIYHPIGIEQAGRRSCRVAAARVDDARY